MHLNLSVVPGMRVCVPEKCSTLVTVMYMTTGVHMYHVLVLAGLAVQVPLFMFQCMIV